MYNFKRNDTKPVIKATLKSVNGSVIDLTGATVRFIMAKYNEIIVNRTAQVVDATKGEVWFSFAPGETARAGSMRVEFKVTYSDGSVETFPKTNYFIIKISPDLAGSPNDIVLDGGNFSDNTSKALDGGGF